MTEDEYFNFCMANRDLNLEQLETRDILVLPASGGETGNRNIEISMQLQIWAKKDGTGKAFDSSTEFRLPRGSARSPDASWVSLARWNALSADERKKFPPLCPEFVLELRSETDRLSDLQDKLVEYMNNGALLGWIVDPFNKTVHFYHPNQEPEILQNPAKVSGEPVLPGFVLDLREIFPA
jgi:Uma2 family endonuclease